LQKPQLILNIVLFAAIAILYGLHFSSQGPSASDPGMKSQKDSTQDVSEAFKIAYINSDTLLEKYVYFTELEEELQQEQQRLEAEYRRRATNLQQEIANFQQSIGGMSLQNAQAKEKELMQKQQDLMAYQERLTQQLINREAELNTALYEKVSDYLRNYAQNNELELILTYTQGSGVRRSW
jgi:outer membrane protein